MAAAENQCPRAVECVEQGERLRAGSSSDDRSDQKKRCEKNECDNACPFGDWKI
jgi:hypothetical protein